MGAYKVEILDEEEEDPKEKSVGEIKSLEKEEEDPPNIP